MNSLSNSKLERMLQTISCALIILTASISMLACANNGGDDEEDENGSSTPAAIFVSNNGGTNSHSIDTYDGNLNFVGNFMSGFNQGIAIDIDNNVYQAGDLGSFGAIMGSQEGAISNGGAIAILGDFPNRSGGSSTNFSRDRIIGGVIGGLSQLDTPKGMTIVHNRGYLLVADIGTSDIKVFGTTAAGDVAPLAVTPVVGIPWDVAYCSSVDILFVSLTNGTIAIFDSYIDNGFGQAGPTRSVTPSSNGISGIGFNLHGIEVGDIADDILIVSDVGSTTMTEDPNFNSDGSIYIFNNIETINGPVIPDRIISGPTTLLGNPVDLFLKGDSLFVAEKANSFILRFDDILTTATGDIAPTSMTTAMNPESLAPQTTNGFENPDISDIDSQNFAANSILALSNPAVADANTGLITEYFQDLSLALSSFDSGESLENITLDITGNAYVTYDDGSNMNGGIIIINRLRNRTETLTDSRDRRITGVGTGLVSPKGIEIARSLGLVLVAENSATQPSIRAFGLQASGPAAPIFATDLSAIGRPWDLDYDPTNDRLFVSLTNGTVAVFDQYSVSMGAAGASRIITPSNGVSQVSVNLHGIVYVASSDALILSDVGDAADSTDGQLFVIPAATTASGLSLATTIIGGPQSMLGNPVDIALNGSRLFVAEKANGMILRFDDVLTLPTADRVPDQAIVRAAVESLCPNPSYLGRAPSK